MKKKYEKYVGKYFRRKCEHYIIVFHIIGSEEIDVIPFFIGEEYIMSKKGDNFTIECRKGCEYFLDVFTEITKEEYAEQISLGFPHD